MSHTASRLATLFVGTVACVSMGVIGASTANAEEVTTEDVVVGTGPGQPCVIVGGTTIGTGGIKFGPNTGVYTNCPV